jgi:hypothetical protein
MSFSGDVVKGKALCLHNPYAELAEEETKMFMSVKILRGE